MDPKYIDAVAKLLDPRRRELEPAHGDLGCSGMQIRGINVDKRTVTAMVSTPNVDRYEEIVEPEAFRRWLPEFTRNPVFAAGHRYVGSACEPGIIGHWTELRITKDGLLGTAVFAETPVADQYWQLYKGGHMRAFSVGWITHEWEMRSVEVKPGVMRRIRVFLSVELLEISAVAIPANRESLVRAASKHPASKSKASLGKTADDDAIAEKLSNRQLSTAARMLAPVVQRAIHDELRADPGSALCALIQDVVDITAQTYAQTRGDVEDYDYDDSGGDDDDTKDIDPVEKLVKDILGRPSDSCG